MTERSEAQIRTQDSEQITARSEESSSELRFHAQAIEEINKIAQRHEDRDKERYKGLFGKVTKFFDREGFRNQSQTLDEVGVWQKNATWKKYAKIGLKVGGGFGLGAAMVFTGGAGAIITPLLWSMGVREGWDGVLQGIEHFGWGKKRSAMEMNVQDQLSEQIQNFKNIIRERGQNLTAEEYQVALNSMLDTENNVIDTHLANMKSERKSALVRTIASTALTIGTGIFTGVPLGVHDYDKGKTAVAGKRVMDAAHKIIFNFRGGQFLYNSPTEIARIDNVPEVVNHLWTYIKHFESFGRASHELGRLGIGLPEKIGLVNAGAYLMVRWILDHMGEESKQKKHTIVAAVQAPTYYPLVYAPAMATPAPPYAPITPAPTVVGVALPPVEFTPPSVPMALVPTKKKYTDEELRQIEFSRRATEITLDRVENYTDLWTTSEQEGDEKFLQKTRELWKELVVHGDVKQTKEGKTIFVNFTDIDGRISLSLLRLAGINTDNVEFVKKGGYTPGKINIDTGDRHGLVLEETDEEGKPRTVFIDHHTDESGGDTCAAKITYETLLSLGLLKRSPELDKLLQFITYLDNANYPDSEKYYFESYHMMLGLTENIKFEDLLELIRSGKNPTDILTDEEMEKIEPYVEIEEGKKAPANLKEVSDRQKKILEDKLDKLKKFEQEGYIIPSDKYGKILVDTRVRGLPVGFPAALAFGCGAYIVWRPRQKSFFVSSREPLLDDFNPQNLPGRGKRIRRTMWIKPMGDESSLNITLKEILEKMTDGKLQPQGKLKEYLEYKPNNRHPRLSARSVGAT